MSGIMKPEFKVLSAYVMIGIVTGYISFLINKNYESLLLAIIVLYLTPVILKRVLKINEKFKWFLSNGGWHFVFVWFITWVALNNYFYPSFVP